jgi:hypothetical protein
MIWQKLRRYLSTLFPRLRGWLFGEKVAALGTISISVAK